VEDSIFFEGVDIGRHAKIRRAIIDKEVHIPQETEIGYNLEEDAKRFTVTPSGIAVVPKWIKL
jgi:glucose-1-phosphate adenylyltransferase